MDTDPELFALLVTYHGFSGDASAMAEAVARKSPTYPGTCEKHGPGVFSTTSGRCEACFGHVYENAKAAGVRNYEAPCRFCHHRKGRRGAPPVTLHRVSDNQCLECIVPRGDNTPRKEARRRGLQTYPARCEPCGAERPHSVANGRCQVCYTSGGQKRTHAARGRPAQDEARAAARRSGAPTYLGRCETHGETEHSVLRGKCLTCFNTAGAPRLDRSARAPSRRAVARRSGFSLYRDFCEPCDSTSDHSVAHGKCLTCFNAAGQPRKRLTRTDGAVKP